MKNILRGYIKKEIFVIFQVILWDIKITWKKCEFGATTQILIVVLENYIYKIIVRENFKNIKNLENSRITRGE